MGVRHGLGGRAMTRRQFVASAAAAGLGAGERAGAGQARPNVLFILADDLGWMDSALYGSRFYRTPNLARLAARGMMFTQAYSANPLCSPTRASLMTGQYPGRLRFTTPAGHLQQAVLDPKLPQRAAQEQKAVCPETRTRLPLEYHTVAEALRDAGYRTAHFGKWHLGWDPYLPTSQGFDRNQPGGSYPGPPSYFAPYRIPGFADGPAGEQIDDRLTAEAVRFIEEPGEAPFFLNYWLFSVHAPFQGKPDLMEQYRSRVDPANPQKSPIMGAMVETMDACLGRLLDALDRTGKAANTLVVFMSDNGGNMYDRPEGVTPTSNAPLRGGKATIYEGGTRVPLLVAWPGKAKPGSRSEEIVSSIDWYPTLLAACGARGKRGQTIDGISLLPALAGRTLRREAIFCHFPHYVPATGNLPSTWVRQGDWKLIRFYADGPKQEDRFELYNLREDLGETRDLATQQPDRVRKMNALIDRHLRDTDALVPKPNPAYAPPVAGWYGNPQAQLALQGGALVVECSGGDPSMTTREVPDQPGPFVLELRMRSRSTGQGQALWATEAQPGFARPRSVFFTVTHDGEWHDYQVALPVATAITSLRLDPCMAPGRVEIAHIRLLTRTGAVAHEWRW